MEKKWCMFFCSVIVHANCAEEPCLLIAVLSIERLLGASTQRKEKKKPNPQRNSDPIVLEME